VLVVRVSGGHCAGNFEAFAMNIKRSRKIASGWEVFPKLVKHCFITSI
jgi:hypothetical protein